MTNTNSVLQKDELLKNWQGHRAITRRTIEKFEEKDLFEFSIGGMRTFSEIVSELLAIAAPSLESMATGVPIKYSQQAYKSKDEILKAWDESTVLIDRYYDQIPVERFQEVFNLYGEYNYKIVDNIFYFIDNEIHHRGQGYVYLRALGIEPPFFWERA